MRYANGKDERLAVDRRLGTRSRGRRRHGGRRLTRLWPRTPSTERCLLGKIGALPRCWEIQERSGVLLLIAPSTRAPPDGTPCKPESAPRQPHRPSGSAGGFRTLSSWRYGRWRSRRAQWSAWRGRVSRRCPRRGPLTFEQPDFFPAPNAYCPVRPSFLTTRWQGTRSGTGLFAITLPTAREAFGEPASRANQAYGLTSPRGTSSGSIPIQYGSSAGGFTPTRKIPRFGGSRASEILVSGNPNTRLSVRTKVQS